MYVLDVKRKMKKIYLLLFAFIITNNCLLAQKSAIFTTNGIAIGGYDVVAFFTNSKPVPGVDTLAYNWNNAIWHFSTREHLIAFKTNPDKYAPQYGGYCAYGTAEGHKAPTQVNTWTIVNGKLYFNYNKDVQKSWMPNKEKLIEKADANWILIKDKE